MIRIAIIAVLLTCAGCKKDKPQPVKYDFDEVYLVYDGDESKGYCGYILKGGHHFLQDYASYKPVNLSDTIKEMVRYKMQLETTQQTCECKNPGGQPEMQQMTKVNILSVSRY